MQKARQAGSASLKTFIFSWEVCQFLADVVSATHDERNTVIVVHSCKHCLQNHHLLSPPWATSLECSAQGSCTNTPSSGVFLPGEGRGIQFIADPLLNWCQHSSHPGSSCTSSNLFCFLQLGWAEVDAQSPRSESVGFVTFTDLPVPESSSGEIAWTRLLPLLLNFSQWDLCVTWKASASVQLQDQGLKSWAPALLLNLTVKPGEAVMGQPVCHTLSTPISLQKVVWFPQTFITLTDVALLVAGFANRLKCRGCARKPEVGAGPG